MQPVVRGVAVGEILPDRGGPLASLARSKLHDRPHLDRLLEDLGAELGAHLVEWLPEGPGPGVGWPIHRPRAIDWALAARVAPAEVHLVGAEDRRRSARLAAGEGREFYVRTGPGVRPAGVLRVVSSKTLPLGRVALVALAELVAEVARAESEAKEVQTARRERRLGQRAACLSHDLRNHLTLALLQLERVRAEPGTPADLDQLEDVLSTARDQCIAGLDGEDLPEPRRLVLRSILVEEARAASSVSRGSRRVRVHTRCPRGLEVSGDRQLLNRLVRNLVLNACEASCAGDSVRVQGRPLEGGRVAIVVEDEGRGMDRARLEGLLSPGRAEGDGTGYGSTSLLECLIGLGAECEIASSPGEGTRVEVRLEGPPEPGAPAVLVLDPDASRRRRRCASLAAQGRRVIPAADPTTALRALRAGPVGDLIVARGVAGEELETLLARASRTGTCIARLPSGA